MLKKKLAPKVDVFAEEKKVESKLIPKVKVKSIADSIKEKIAKAKTVKRKKKSDVEPEVKKASWADKIAKVEEEEEGLKELPTPDWLIRMGCKPGFAPEYEQFGDYFKTEFGLYRSQCSVQSTAVIKHLSLSHHSCSAGSLAAVWSMKRPCY